MNKQTFNSRTENGRQHFQKLLDTLLDYNSDFEEKYFNDIHIYQEDDLIIIEWDEVPYSHEWGGKWQYIEEDDVVMKDVEFPDGHFEQLFPDEVEERLADWHKENPEWIKNCWGIWYNIEENRIAFISLNANTWMKKEFTENQIELKDSISIYSVINSVNKNVLDRTNFVVLSESLAKKLIKDKALYFGEYSILKLDSYKTNENEILIYVTTKLTDDAIYYVTKDNSVIHRLKVEEGK